MSRRVEIYDVTLRDGAQGPGVKFTANDQLRVVQELDDFGVKYIEGGQPGSNPKAIELFKRTKDMELKNAIVVAFGSTRHPQSAPEDDRNLHQLLSAETEVVTIFAKSSPTQAREILKVGLDENLDLIEDSITYLRDNGRRVFLDGEHFFDGYFEDAEYALSAMERGWNAGAEVLIACDTNGGRLPWEIAEAMKALRERIPEAMLGIHAHNDSDCGTANTLTAVQAGAVQIQGTINGYGERTGNANLCCIIPDVQLKMGIEVVSEEQLCRLTHLSHFVAELANMVPREFAPFVGRDAFTHKGGMHADAVRKLKTSYEHVDPRVVGNVTHIPVSEMSGRSSVLGKAKEFDIHLERGTPETMQILDQVKNLENEGFEFEGADASLELLMRRTLGQYRPFFTLQGYHVSIARQGPAGSSRSEASVKIQLPNGDIKHTVAEGDGPVDALNNALRKALEDVYPEVKSVHLEDYKVRILDGAAATRSKTRVFIESTDGETSWDTVGVSENVITASYEALIDSIEYKLLKSRGFEGQ